MSPVCVDMITLRRVAAALLALAMIACLPGAVNAETVRDASGRSVEVKDANRIVSIGGAVTEILYALGLKDRVVAVDATSLYPDEALKQKPSVGYFRALSAEGVLGLNPSLVLAIDGAGPKETLSVLEAATVPFVRVPDHYSADGILQKMRLIAQATGERDRGECRIAQVSADLAALTALRAKIKEPAKVMFVISFLNGKPMVAGRNTAADGIIRMAGAVNAIEAYEGYKQISDEAVIAAGPDTVLVMQRGRDNIDAATVFSHAAFTMTPAAARKSFVAMDGLYLLGFGPRTATAARDLAETLYPALGHAVLPSEQRTRSGCY
jgi:iron complex transport system substrate-binding protein